MKQCPKCSRTYADDTLAYCLDDGSALVTGYDAQATLVIPPPRVTDVPATQASLPPPAPSYPEPKRSKTWPIFVVVALVLLLLVGGGITLLIYAYSQMPASSSAKSNPDPEKQGAPSPDPSKSELPTPPTANSLVGTWRTDVDENGERTEITVTFRADGASDYAFKYADGKRATDYGTWQYSDGTIFERFSNGASGKGSIRWIDQDNIELTIIDNGVPAYTGLKRSYRRVP